MTGSNTGIGLYTAKLLAEMGADVIVACRTMEKAKQAIKWMKINSTKEMELIPMELDLSRLASVLKFVDEYQKNYNKLDILINNAGVYKPTRELTADGLEEMMGVNHVGHFLLTNKLLHLMKKRKSRIINVSSGSHAHASHLFLDDWMAEKSFFHYRQYSNSKLANHLFSFQLNKMLNGTGVCVYTVHPVKKFFFFFFLIFFLIFFFFFSF